MFKQIWALVEKVPIPFPLGADIIVAVSFVELMFLGVPKLGVSLALPESRLIVPGVIVSLLAMSINLAGDPDKLKLLV